MPFVPPMPMPRTRSTLTDRRLILATLRHVVSQERARQAARTPDTAHVTDVRDYYADRLPL